jgi:hypothetical protein
MLWLKGWMETRFRLLFMLGFTVVFFSLTHRANTAGRGHAEAVLTAIVTYSIPGAVVMICAFMGGAGIVTQPSLQATKGLHGSTLYTLSMPASRLRVVAVRATIGWLEVVGLIGVLFSELWFGFSLVRETATPLEMLEQAATVIVCTSILYFVSVVLATLLDDQWRTWGTMLAAVAMYYPLTRYAAPPAVNVYWAMTKGSPLLAHSIPWSAMGFSVALSVVLFLVAVAIARRREY